MSLPLLIDFLREARVVALGVAAGISPYGQSVPQPGQGPPVLPPILAATPEPGKSVVAAPALPGPAVAQAPGVSIVTAPASPGPLAPPDAEEIRTASLLLQAGVDTPLRRRALAQARRLQDRQEQVRYLYFTSGYDRERAIALTFDDGPEAINTPRILDVLKAEKVRATFFVLGEKAIHQPELLQRIVIEGHDLGSHGYHHYSLPKMGEGEIRREIDRSRQVIAAATGLQTRWYRAPGCRYSALSLQILRQLGLVRVDPSANSGDYLEKGREHLLWRTADRTRGGGIVLCHDWSDDTAKHLRDLIRKLRGKGYRFVSLGELALRAQQKRFIPPFTLDSEGVVVEPPTELASDPSASADWLRAARLQLFHGEPALAAIPVIKPAAAAVPGRRYSRSYSRYSRSTGRTRRSSGSSTAFRSR